MNIKEGDNLEKLKAGGEAAEGVKMRVAPDQSGLTTLRFKNLCHPQTCNTECCFEVAI